MKHRSPYSVVDVNEICVASIIDRRRGQSLVLGVDVAKGELIACLVGPDRSFDRPWRTRSPQQIRLAVRKILELREQCPLVVAMESSDEFGR